MLRVRCTTCEEEFWVEGYTTHDSWYEPGEVVTDLIPKDDPLCEHLNQGGDFEVISEDHPVFDDDVI